jgi:predicted RNA binding protein YcfA (HicA-like mRNA interferase family)
MKVRDVLKALKKDGWTFRNQEGSHQQLIHPIKPGKVTVHGHPSLELDRKTLTKIDNEADRFAMNYAVEFYPPAQDTAPMCRIYRAVWRPVTRWTRPVS